MTSSKHDDANYDQFAPSFGVAYDVIQSVCLPNFKLFGSMKTEVWTKEVGELSITLYGKMGWCPGHHHGCRNINA